MPKEMIYLDRNENHYGPAPACYQVLMDVTLEEMSWYSRDFVRGVKSRLSERLAKEFGVAEALILLGYGSEDILKQVVHCYLKENERIMIPTHSWWYYKAIADEVKGIKVEYPMVVGKDSFLYDVDAMLRLHAKEKPTIILISSPNNPTGNSLATEDLRFLLSKVKDTIVVLDEAYWGFNIRENGYIKELVERYPNLLIIRTFSKYYALAGNRIGFAFMGKNLGQLSRFSARYLGYHRLSEALALAALDSSEYYREVARKMIDDKQRYYDELGRISGFKVYKSDANFVLVEILGAVKALLKESLTNEGILVKFFDEDNLRHCVRITVGTEQQNHLLIDAIKATVKARVLV